MKHICSIIYFIIVSITAPIIAATIPVYCIIGAIVRFFYQLIQDKKINKNFFIDLFEDLLDEYEKYFS